MKEVIFISVILIAFAVKSQSNQVSVSGSSERKAEHTVSWTLGQTISTTFVKNGYSLTQGVHQPIIIIEQPVLGIQPMTPIRVFPNPFKEHLKVDIGNISMDKVEIIVTDLTGKIVMKKSEESEIINLSGVPDGTYVLRIYVEGSKPSSFTILKNSTSVK